MRIKSGYIVIGLSLIIGLSAVAFFLMPSYQSLASARESTIETRINLDETEQLSQRNSALAEKYRVLEANLAKLNNRLLTPANALDLLTALETLARDHNLTINVNKLDAPSPNNNTATIDLSLVGSLTDLLQYLRQLENSQWLVNFDTVSLVTALSSARSAETGAGLTLSLVGKTYWSATQ